MLFWGSTMPFLVLIDNREIDSFLRFISIFFLSFIKIFYVKIVDLQDKNSLTLFVKRLLNIDDKLIVIDQNNITTKIRVSQFS